jgi:Rrf2 family iron-sulfur cluster assembly transcriptional regulator
MRFTTKGRRAVIAMTDLAVREGRGPVTLAGIGVRQAISLSYLEQLFGLLRRHGLVTSSRGPGGGYRLGRDVGDITVADIVAAVDSADEAQIDHAERDCSRGLADGRCDVDDLWLSLHNAMIEHMRAISLRSLADDRRRLDPSSWEAVPPARRSLITPAVAPAPAPSGASSVFSWARHLP